MPAAAATSTSTTIKTGRPDFPAGALPRRPPSANPDITTASGAGGWRRSESPGGGSTAFTVTDGSASSLFGAGGAMATAAGESDDCSAPSSSVAQLALAASALAPKAATDGAAAATGGAAAGMGGAAAGMGGAAAGMGGAAAGSESSASLGSSAIACAVISAVMADGVPSGA